MASLICLNFCARKPEKGLFAGKSWLLRIFHGLFSSVSHVLAVFMAEKGAECLTDHKEAILQCVNTTFPELYLAQAQGGGTRRRSVDPVMIFNEDNCRYF